MLLSKLLGESSGYLGDMDLLKAANTLIDAGMIEEAGELVLADAVRQGLVGVAKTIVGAFLKRTTLNLDDKQGFLRFYGELLMIMDAFVAGEGSVHYKSGRANDVMIKDLLPRTATDQEWWYWLDLDEEQRAGVVREAMMTYSDISSAFTKHGLGVQ